ncbi:MAG: aspartate aminotransferase family protein [Candidatus Gygaella obscura]|nr:aspartate aminotransferase family protein [Candidatus Gygaella obscura]
MKKQELFELYNERVLATYTKTPLVFVKGKGSYLWDIHNNKYLDFFPGWGVCNVGHCNSAVMSAVRDQISKLIFVPNNYYNLPQAKLVKEITYWSFPSKVFFCNSGAEANEAAIKFSRIFGKGKRHEIITFENSFHGRTFGALSATGQEKYKQPFKPLLEGFKTVKFNDIEAVKMAITEKTVAAIIEPIQGEGGVNIAQKSFIQDLRKICNEKDILLIFDEVQTGIGRTGEMFCYKHYDVTPDVMTLAKSVAGGFPMGVMLVKKSISDIFTKGMHASTFGGGPVICKAALGVFKAISKEKMIANAKIQGKYLFEKLLELKKKYPIIKEIRALGLMVGIELNCSGEKIVQECIKHNLLINCTHDNVLRLMPALNVKQAQIKTAMRILNKVFEENI